MAGERLCYEAYRALVLAHHQVVLPRWGELSVAVQEAWRGAVVQAQETMQVEGGVHAEAE